MASLEKRTRPPPPKRPGACALTDASGNCNGFLAQHDFLAFLLAGTHKIEGSHYDPQDTEAQRVERFVPAHACYREWTNQIENHTTKVGYEPKHWDDEVFEPVERVVFLERHHRNDARGHVEHEGAEIADQRD